jgi:hypothetical protein
MKNKEERMIIGRTPILSKSGNTVTASYGFYRDKDGKIKPLYLKMTNNGDGTYKLSGNVNFQYED